MYILFVIISPVISKFTNQEFNFDDIDYDAYLNSQTQQVSSNSMVQTNQNSIEQMYLAGMKEEISKSLRDKGYEVKTIQIEADLKEGENYGRIKAVSLMVLKANPSEVEESKVESIPKVEIGNNSTKGAEKGKEEENRKISEKEQKEVIQYLSKTYGIEQNNIRIET